MTEITGKDRPKDWLARAVSLHDAGHFEDAKSLYHKVLGVYPDHAGTLHMLGLAEYESGQYQAAISQFKKAVSSDSRHAGYLGSLADAYKAAGDFERAIQTYRKALTLDPSLAGLQNSLGFAQQQTGDHLSARDAFRKALALNARFPEAETRLAVSLTALGETDTAIKHLRRALSVDPQYARAHAELGQIYRDSGRIHAAIENFQTACKLEPTADLYVQLGEACTEDGRFETAISAYSEALALRPKDLSLLSRLARAEASRGELEQAEHLYRAALDGGDKRAETFFTLGGILLDTGRRFEAIQNYRWAVEADPDFAPAYRMIATCVHHDEESEDIAGIRAAHERSMPASPARMHLGFALGKVEEDLGHTDVAFAHFAEANRLHRQTIDYDAFQTRQRLETVTRLFDAALFDKNPDAGLPDRGPVFIVGMPQSGMAEIEDLLVTHQKVHGTGEARLVSTILSEAGLGDPSTLFSETVASLPRDRFAELGRTYLTRTRPLAPDAQLIINSEPDNFWRIGMIGLMLPNARIVHCRRDPAEAGLSIFAHCFAEGAYPYAYDLGELGDYYASYQRLMAHWHKVLPGFVYDLNYESFLADRDGESRKLLDWLGLGWSDEIQDFNSNQEAQQAGLPDRTGLAARYGEALAPFMMALMGQS